MNSFASITYLEITEYMDKPSFQMDTDLIIKLILNYWNYSSTVEVDNEKY